MDSSIERMVQYCSGIAKEFEAKLNRIRTFVPDHNLTSGTANEIILRDFLAHLSTGRYVVGQGFICSPTASDLVSKQCDILVYDHHDYPLVHSEGEVVLVFPDAAKMVIEVKTSLDKKALEDALENIRSAKQLNYTINGVVFAYKSPNPETVIGHLQQYTRQLSMKHAPTAILLFDKGVIIHRWSGTGTELGGGENLYEVRVSKNEDSAIVVMFLLLLFFEVQLLGWGGASVANMIKRMLEDRTDTIAENVQIGNAA
ncbi:MAG: hypothetical protein H8E47_06395 [Anaerolineales bacterium]|nr:hypothetical protein [Anaerolineales bacterium]